MGHMKGRPSRGGPYVLTRTEVASGEHGTTLAGSEDANFRGLPFDYRKRGTVRFLVPLPGGFLTRIAAES